MRRSHLRRRTFLTAHSSESLREDGRRDYSWVPMGNLDRDGWKPTTRERVLVRMVTRQTSMSLYTLPRHPKADRGAFA
jgi:hypothetical protein